MLALQLEDKYGFDETILPILRLLSNVSFRNKKYNLAKEYAERALIFSQNLNISAEIGATQYLLISIASVQNEFDYADKLIDEAVDLFRKIGNKRYEAFVLHERSLNFFEQNFYELEISDSVNH